MDLPTYHILHLASIFVLLGYTFYAAAAPAATKRSTMMITGIAALTVLVTGFGMLHRMGLAFQGWVVVKLVCWLLLSAIAGVAYRKREKAGLWMALALILAVTATAMVYVKPF